MGTALTERVCICAGNHGLPIADCEIFHELDEAWDASEIHRDSSLSDVKAVDYFFECHVEADVWSRYLAIRHHDTCTQGGGHRRSKCDDNCFSPDPDRSYNER
jgi:hypothetical protein